MKKIVLLSLLILTFLFSCVSSTYETQTREITKNNTSANELYILVNEFLVYYIERADASIEFSDKEEGKIMGNFIKSGSGYKTTYEYTYDIDIKNNALSVSIKGIDKNAYGQELNVNTDFLNELELYIKNNSHKSN